MSPAIQYVQITFHRANRSHMKDMLRGDLLATGLPSSQQQQRRGAGYNTPAMPPEDTRETRFSKRPREAQLAAELKKNADVIRQKHNNIYYGIINKNCVLPGKYNPKQVTM